MLIAIDGADKGWFPEALFIFFQFLATNSV